jgi:metal-sulfur cluster biosynthetic enzyme
MATMDPEMIRKIDAVLERVREPEGGLPVRDTGLVQRLRYVPEEGKLKVFVTLAVNPKACCFLITGAIEASVLDQLRSELEKEFPELEIELV